MGILEDFPELYMIVPALVAVGCVAVTVLVIFRLGLGKQRTFEEAKAVASRQAELVLQERESKNSPRAKKPKKSFPRKKKTEQWEEPQEEATPDTQARKGILKPVTITSRKEATPERSPRNRVEFNIDASTRDDTKNPRVDPPTPHPSKSAAPIFKVKELPRTTQPLFEEPEEEAEVESTTVLTSSPPTKAKAPEPKKVAAEAVSPKTATPKKKQKAKRESGEPAGPPDEGLPASRIVEIVGVSSLSDDDIQQLVSVLLEKMNTNSEWEAANLRTESVKSLKKQNQELQKRCEDAEKTVHSHNTKIKELRAEIQNEKFKHQSTDAKLQAKTTAHANEISIIKTRLQGMEKENTELKADSNTVNLQKLKEDNVQLRSQIHQLTTQSTQHSSQLKQLSEENTALKSDLRSAKEAYKSATAGQPRADRVSELQSLIKNMEEENERLQVDLHMMNDENTRLKGETASMQLARNELDQLKAKTGNLEAKNSALADENAALLQEIEQLRNETNSAQNADNSEAVRAQLEEKIAQEVESVRGELSAEVQGLRGTVTELEGRCGEKEREVTELKTQIEKCSSLQDELKALSEELSGEQTAKKELEQELESLKQTVANGPSYDEPDRASVNEEELTRLREEKGELQGRVKELEKKLDDLKDKNNSLRNNLWKTKDTAAEDAKTWQAKVAEAYKKTEVLCKEAKREALSEAQDAQKAFVSQLFPSISVSAGDFSEWLDRFEVKVQEILTEKDDEVTSLRSKVAELQDNEQRSIQEAEGFRQTLQETMDILERLQSEVEGRDAEHQTVLKEKEEMLERERTSNRGLQEELRKEKELTSSLRADLQAASEAGDSQTSVDEVEARLKESEHQHELSKQEVESLRHSLKHELEMKEQVQEELEQLKEKQDEIEKRLVVDEEEKKKSSELVTQLQSEIKQLQSQLHDANEKIAASEKLVAPPNPAVDTEV